MATAPPTAVRVLLWRMSSHRTWAMTEVFAEQGMDAPPTLWCDKPAVRYRATFKVVAVNGWR